MPKAASWSAPPPKAAAAKTKAKAASAKAPGNKRSAMNALKNIRRGLQYQHETGNLAVQESVLLYCDELLSAASATGSPGILKKVWNLKETKDRDWTEHHDNLIKTHMLNDHGTFLFGRPG